jgi:signal transduction histidine kinase
VNSAHTQTPELERLDDDLAAIATLDVVPTILEIVCRTTGLGFSAVARVTDDRWIACAVRDEIGFGLEPGGELQVQTTICSEVRDSGQLVVIDHVATDAQFRDHPTPKMYGFESYISVPIRRVDGRLFGTLCAIDPRPARLNSPGTIGMFQLFANLIALHLDAQERLQVTHTALLDERERAVLQDQFIAVLGHDLRNPLSAVQTGSVMLKGMALPGPAAKVVTIIDRSAARMAGLIDNVLDFARGRLGGGLTVTRISDSGLEAVMEQVIAEMRTARPDRVINCDLAVGAPVVCDRVRIGQLLSNLLANALSHGDPSGPVSVRAHTGPGFLELSVSNLGTPIPETIMSRLFQPFERAASRSESDGLGLGLYIASEIARAHDGTLDVQSSEDETRFTFRMPA